MNINEKIRNAKLTCLEMCVNAGEGHLSSALSCAEIVCVLYYSIMKYDINNPKWESRDRFIMSKNHGGIITYPILEDLGFWPKGQCSTFLQNGSAVGSHSKFELSGVDFTGGALGIGLGVACGMSYAAKLKNSEHLTFCLVGDGECYEGGIWESAMFAGAHDLYNLIVVVDRNRQCITDFTEKMLPLNPLVEKWEAFGWEVREINGHSVDEIHNALTDVRIRRAKPLCVIANTIKGNGIDFMENKQLWHGRTPSGNDAINARIQLEGRC